MRVIAPYTEQVRVSFETAKEMPELDSGFNMAKLGNWDAAIEIFQKAISTYSNSPLVHKAYYNLGLSYMYTDQFDQAQTALDKAYAGKPDERKYKNAIKDLKTRIKDKRRLEEQGQPDAEEGDSEPMQEQGQPDAEEGDSEPMQEQGQPDAEEGDSEPMQEQGQPDAEEGDSEPMQEQGQPDAEEGE